MAYVYVMWIWDLIHFHACLCVVCIAVCVSVLLKNCQLAENWVGVLLYIKDWPKHTSVSWQNDCFLCNTCSALSALVSLFVFWYVFVFFIPPKQSYLIRMFTGIQYTFHVKYIYHPSSFLTFQFGNLDLYSRSQQCWKCHNEMCSFMKSLKVAVHCHSVQSKVRFLMVTVSAYNQRKRESVSQPMSMWWSKYVQVT